jgi:hypothetical protein
MQLAQIPTTGDTLSVFCFLAPSGFKIVVVLRMPKSCFLRIWDMVSAFHDVEGLSKPLADAAALIASSVPAKIIWRF